MLHRFLWSNPAFLDRIERHAYSATFHHQRPSIRIVSKAKPSPPSPGQWRTLRWLIVVAGVFLAGGAVCLFAWERGPATYGYRVVNTYPHDAGAYSQGLVVHDGKLIEGTGRTGRSSLRRVELESGRVLEKHDLHPSIFGEGVTVFDGKIYQLTWKAGGCFVYDPETFQEVGRFRYQGEGWGLTHDGTNLIMSDGSSALQFRDPKTFKLLRRVWVKSSGRPVAQLNELEYINGEVWANVWKQDYIIRINPETGDVIGWINLADLYPRRLRAERDFVLNGIAYDAENGRIFVTGKSWPKLYEIEVVPQR